MHQQQDHTTTALALGAATEPTMSSREISALVESRHDKVKQSIDRLVERGVIVQPPMGDEPLTDAMGRQRSERVYRLCKRDSYIVVAQLSPEFTARLVDRWEELERQVRQPINPASLSRMDLIQLALAAETEAQTEREHRLAVQAINEELAPKAVALDLIAGTDGSYSITEAAKALQKRPKDAFKELSTRKWIYRRPGASAWCGYQDKINAGLLEHKVTTIERDDRPDKSVTQVRVTPKGLAKLAEALGVGLLQ
ncbi:phage antirepressor KilAC domain-containing protein [Caulobacter sp. SSI4214]|uniref:phage antirepressor KilAC domain-containing protein n=1 Tax=Caulobacter sp. SSI4214 TaxID=2575739 RepID=UPI001438E76A|nr:phage antirepressor KilAC domain-containing protein [Caulobacter sp. SSI4214]